MPEKEEVTGGREIGWILGSRGQIKHALSISTQADFGRHPGTGCAHTQTDTQACGQTHIDRLANECKGSGYFLQGRIYNNNNNNPTFLPEIVR